MVFGFAIAKEENSALCQAEESPPAVELVVRDDKRDKLNIWRELLVPDWPLIIS